ncbi:hypothetical protein D3C77_555220 [compost metagenome]
MHGDMGVIGKPWLPLLDQITDGQQASIAPTLELARLVGLPAELVNLPGADLDVGQRCAQMLCQRQALISVWPLNFCFEHSHFQPGVGVQMGEDRVRAGQNIVLQTPIMQLTHAAIETIPSLFDLVIGTTVRLTLLDIAHQRTADDRNVMPV